MGPYHSEFAAANCHQTRFLQFLEFSAALEQSKIDGSASRVVFSSYLAGSNSFAREGIFCFISSRICSAFF